MAESPEYDLDWAFRHVDKKNAELSAAGKELPRITDPRLRELTIRLLRAGKRNYEAKLREEALVADSDETAIPLTAFQADEVSGLLDVLADEQKISGDRRPWGRLRGRALVVLDPADAADDLRYRADFLLAEASGSRRSGVSGARSLRQLADTLAPAESPDR